MSEPRTEETYELGTNLNIEQEGQTMKLTDEKEYNITK